ncbi:MAG: isoprenyl transferase [Dehalococcoidia bacterium]|nr:isoprenyl transferase [Dehalococcoidia bacterium]MDD5647375.1 isoprenyl transferase [Dehalococcoidia bacterium]
MTGSLKKFGLPQHVAIVMDGNGRWAARRHKPRLYGHKQGALHARDFVEIFAEYGIPYLTLYAFSTENWSRPKAEVDGIIKLLSENLDRAVKIAHEQNIRIRHLGKEDRLPEAIQRKARAAIEKTSNNSGLTVNVAFNYGGRSEIVNATQQIIRNRIKPDSLDESVFSRYLYTADMPDPDLFIRTGGEMRVSNFLIWQSAYAELYFTSVLWPDFGRDELQKALTDFGRRQRRFGGLKPK